MKIILVSKCFLDIEQYVEFEMSVLISPSKSLISSCWVTCARLQKVEILAHMWRCLITSHPYSK